MSKQKSRALVAALTGWLLLLCLFVLQYPPHLEKASAAKVKTDSEQEQLTQGDYSSPFARLEEKVEHAFASVVPKSSLLLPLDTYLLSVFFFSLQALLYFSFLQNSFSLTCQFRILPNAP